MYGQGTYFASQSCKAHQYTCESHPHGCRCPVERTLILSRVVLGDPHYAKQTLKNMVRPPERGHGQGTYDSIVANPGPMKGHQWQAQDHQEFVIFTSAIYCSVRGVCHCAAPINEVCEETAQAGREAGLRLIRAIHHKNPEKKPSDIRTELQHLLPECQTVGCNTAAFGKQKHFLGYGMQTHRICVKTYQFVHAWCIKNHYFVGTWGGGEHIYIYIHIYIYLEESGRLERRGDSLSDGSNTVARGYVRSWLWSSATSH
jgi:hypothetical protein